MNKYHLEVEIEGLPKTVNSIGRKHWAVKAAEAKHWKALVSVFCSGKTPAKPLNKAKITLTRFSSASPDSDGLVSSFKHVLDGLISAGVITDDKYQNIGMPDYRWELAAPKFGRIKIEVNEV